MPARKLLTGLSHVFRWSNADGVLNSNPTLTVDWPAGAQSYSLTLSRQVDQVTALSADRRTLTVTWGGSGSPTTAISGDQPAPVVLQSIGLVGAALRVVRVVTDDGTEGTLELAELGGLGKAAPRLAFLFGIAGMVTAGLAGWAVARNGLRPVRRLTTAVEQIARTGKPVIMSTGMATLAEIDEAVRTLRGAGCPEIALLKCTSAYPSPPEAMNLRTIPHLAQAFQTPVGLSDHTLGTTVPVAAVALGACIIEKHFTVSREIPSADRAFSLEPHEFRAMVDAVRMTEQALGVVHYGVDPAEEKSRVFRRSLFVVQDVKAGEPFTAENVRSIRPGHGLHTRYLDAIIGRRARQDVARGTPLDWGLLA